MKEGKDKLFAQNWIEQFQRKWRMCNDLNVSTKWFSYDVVPPFCTLMGQIQNWDQGEGRIVWSRRNYWFESQSRGLER